MAKTIVRAEQNIDKGSLEIESTSQITTLDTLRLKVNSDGYLVARYDRLLPITEKLFLQGTLGLGIEGSVLTSHLNDGDSVYAPLLQAKVTYIAHPKLGFYTTATKVFELNQTALLSMQQVLVGGMIKPIDKLSIIYQWGYSNYDSLHELTSEQIFDGAISNELMLSYEVGHLIKQLRTELDYLIMIK